MKRLAGINNQKWIDGINMKVHEIENSELFNMALDLLDKG